MSSSFAATGPISRVVVTSSSVSCGGATTGKRWRVIGGLLVAGAAGATLLFNTSSSTPTALTGTIVLGNNAPLILPESPVGYIESNTGEALLLAVSSGAVNGTVVVQEVAGH